MDYRWMYALYNEFLHYFTTQYQVSKQGETEGLGDGTHQMLPSHRNMPLEKTLFGFFCVFLQFQK